MNLYMASTLSWSYSVEESIALAKQLGLYGVEVWAEHVFRRDADPDKIAETARKFDVPLTLHASSWDLNICSMNTGILRQSITEIEKSIELADMLNARNVTIHPGYMSPSGFLAEKCIEVMAESLHELATFADRRGVTLSVEMMEELPRELMTDPASMNALLEKLPNTIKTTFDIAHVPIHISPLCYYQDLQRVNKIHLSDSSYSFHHVPLGSGEIQLNPILNEIREEKTPIVLEGFETGRSLVFLKNHLEYLQENGWMGEHLFENSYHQ